MLVKGLVLLSAFVAVIKGAAITDNGISHHGVVEREVAGDIEVLQRRKQAKENRPPHCSCPACPVCPPPPKCPPIPVCPACPPVPVCPAPAKYALVALFALENCLAADKFDSGVDSRVVRYPAINSCNPASALNGVRSALFYKFPNDSTCTLTLYSDQACKNSLVNTSSDGTCITLGLVQGVLQKALSFTVYC